MFSIGAYAQTDPQVKVVVIPLGADDVTLMPSFYIAYGSFPGYSAGPGIISSTALCNEGDLATGGGYSISASSPPATSAGTPTLRALSPVDSYDSPSKPIGWTVVANTTEAGHAVVARAICVDITP